MPCWKEGGVVFALIPVPLSPFKVMSTRPVEASAALRIVVINTVGSSDQAVDEFELAAHKARSAALRIGLLEAGYDIVASIPGDMYLIDRITQLAPDMIIIDAESDARDVLEHMVIATQSAPRPIVLFTEDNNSEKMKTAIEAGVSAYVVAGLQSERVKPVLEVALARFQVEQRLRAELQSTKTKLAERKLIEKAKGLLMQKLDLSEEQAYQRLRRQAMEKNLKLVELAQRLLDAADLLG